MPLLAVLLDRRRRVDHPCVDEDEPVGMLDRVGEARQAVTVEHHFARQVPTDVVTAFQPGQTITVSVDEVTFHPGHYRVVLSPTGQGEQNQEQRGDGVATGR